MTKDYPFSEIGDKIASAQKIALALPVNPRLDQVAAGLAFFLSLTNQGKTVSVVCASPMTVEFNRLVGVDKIRSKLAGTDLVININYPLDQIDKVSYNDDNSSPNVVIQPKAGAPALTENLIRYSHGVPSLDLVILMGIQNQDQFGSLTADLSLTQNTITVNLAPGSNLGQTNIIDFTAPALSEVVAALISGLNYSFDQDIAQNILAGVAKGTQNLTSGNMTADTYDVVAMCLRAGAQKGNGPQVKRDNQPPTLNTNMAALPNANPQVNAVVGETDTSPENPPADWLEPKIFKGTSVS